MVECHLFLFLSLSSVIILWKLFSRRLTSLSLLLCFSQFKKISLFIWFLGNLEKSRKAFSLWVHNMINSMALLLLWSVSSLVFHTVLWSKFYVFLHGFFLFCSIVLKILNILFGFSFDFWWSVELGFESSDEFWMCLWESDVLFYFVCFDCFYVFCLTSISRRLVGRLLSVVLDNDIFFVNVSVLTQFLNWGFVILFQVCLCFLECENVDFIICFKCERIAVENIENFL